MVRTRISTTVDTQQLAKARDRLGVSDSVIVDRALGALLDELDAEHEIQALTELPYEDDPDLDWSVPLGPDLPYDGTVPEDVLELARQRRGEQR